MDNFRFNTSNNLSKLLECIEVLQKMMMNPTWIMKNLKTITFVVEKKNYSFSIYFMVFLMLQVLVIVSHDDKERTHKFKSKNLPSGLFWHKKKVRTKVTLYKRHDHIQKQLFKGHDHIHEKDDILLHHASHTYDDL